MKSILIGIFFFVVFLSLAFFMNFIVVRNILIYYVKRYNIYATLASVILLAIIFLFFALSGYFSNIFVIGIKRTINNIVGAIFIFFVLFLILEMIRFFNKDSKPLFFVFMIIGFIVVIFSVFNAFDVDINRIDIESEKVDREYKIAMISDVHLGSNSVKVLDKIAEKVEREKPELLLIVGDFIDEEFIIHENLSALHKISAKKIYALGNHETYLRRKVAESVTTEYDLILLENKTFEYDKNIIVTGVEDNHNKLELLLKDINIKKNKYNILLNHQPSQPEIAKDKGYDLLLSGHTHNGQIFPFNFLVKLRYKHIMGLYQLDDMYHFVSSGVSTWGPKMRLGSDNEIVIFTIKPVK